MTVAEEGSLPRRIVDQLARLIEEHIDLDRLLGKTQSKISAPAIETKARSATDKRPLIAIASDKATGCPVNFNFLIGDEFVKLSSGHAANLAAEVSQALEGFVEAARAAFGTNLVSVTLYGSGAEGRLRPSSDINLIVVLDGSRVMEAGLHEDLLARRGQCADLYGIQAAACR